MTKTYAEAMADYIKKATKPGDKLTAVWSNETFVMDDDGNMVSTGYVEETREVTIHAN